MTKRKTLLALFAALLVLGMSITPAWSYFTDQHEANGTLPIRVKPTTTITEEYVTGVKKVTIHNLATSDTPVFVRARVYASSDLTINVTWDGETWRAATADDADATAVPTWYYCKDPVAVGADAPVLTVTIPELQVENAQEAIAKLTEGDNYNVIVVYESTPVQYNADGTTYADWTISHDVEGGA